MADEKDENTLVIPIQRPRDPIARDLLTPKYRQRIQRQRKGKGSFERKKAIPDDDSLT
jgi:hypothetical protein